MILIHHTIYSPTLPPPYKKTILHYEAFSIQTAIIFKYL